MAVDNAMSRKGWLFLGYLAFVIYGSLVPFEYRDHSLAEALAAFRNIRYLDLGVVSRADWVANILLYIPLAYLTLDWLSSDQPTRHRATGHLGPTLATLALCGITAVGVEFAQIFFAPRTVSLNDLLAEGTGTLLGIILWQRFRPSLQRLAGEFRAGDRQSIIAAITLYLAGYLLLALFPFDLLVSATEWQRKMASGQVDWWLAPACGQGLRCLARLLGEGLAIAPLGLLLALANPRLRIGRVAIAGLVLGLVLELAQLAVASGTSQGLSVLLRGTGLATGAWLGKALQGQSVQRFAEWGRRLALALSAPYLIALATLSGWFSEPWLHPSEALARLSELRFLPLYYHYFSTETRAVMSVLSQLAMYAPVGVFFWSRDFKVAKPQPRLLPPALSAITLAGVIELGKLALPHHHPDLSNLIFAAAGSLAAYLALAWLAQVLEPHTGDTAIEREKRRIPRASVDHGLPAWPTLLGIILPVLVLFAAGLIRHPYGLWLMPLMVLYAVALRRQPLAWLAVVPVVAVVFDLAPLAGRQWLDGLDLVVLVTLLMGYWNTTRQQTRSWPRRTLMIAYLGLWLSWLFAFSRGLSPLWAEPVPPLLSSHSPLEAWMVGKGMLWAFLMVPLLRRIPAEKTDTALNILLAGLFIALAAEVAVILWERITFTGLFDFSSVYRVTGTFASMNTGGAYVEAFLALAFPVSLYYLWNRSSPWLRLSALAVSILAIYAMGVTFSRGGYAGLVAGAFVTVVALVAIARQRRWPNIAKMILVAVLIVLVSLPILIGDFARQRLGQSLPDLSFRLSHWGHALSLMEDGSTAHLVGEGFGTYPREYLTQTLPQEAPASYALTDQYGKRFVRLYPGKPLYLDQVVTAEPGARYRLSARLRFPRGKGELSIALCEKDLLYSFDCQWARFPAPNEGRKWHSVMLELTDHLSGEKPVRLSVANLSPNGPVELAAVDLVDTEGRSLLDNGDFVDDLDHWLHVTDQDLAWHIHQQAVEIYFAQGLLGLLAVTLLLMGTARVLRRSLLSQDLNAAALAGALTGFLIVGLLASTVDSARSAFLFYLVAFAAGLVNNKGRRYRAKRKEHK